MGQRDRHSRRQSTWVILGFAALLVVPALVLAGFGLVSLARHRVVAVHEARKSAGDDARRLADRINQVLQEIMLPSLADVESFAAGPGSPEDEPLFRLCRDGTKTIGLFAYPGGSLPARREGAALPERLNVQELPPEALRLWRGAESAELAAGSNLSAEGLWTRLLDVSANTAWDPAVRFRLARSLLVQGRTEAARPLLESVVSSRASTAGETGLPLEVLALRALLQLGEVDPSVAECREAWVDRLCYRVLVTWRLPTALLEEWEPVWTPRIRRWLEVANLHETARITFQAADILPVDGAESFPPAGRWMDTGLSGPRFLTSHEVAGGAWLLLRTEASLREIVREALKMQPLPVYAAGRVAIGGRVLEPSSPAGEELAEASRGPVMVRLELARPGLLFERDRSRTRVLGGLIALATLTVLLGFAAAARAYARQKQYADLQADFAAGVSHELRAPLAAVHLMVEELRDMPPHLEARRARYHQLVLREIRRLALLVENVLRHAGLQRGSAGLAPEPIDIGEPVRAAIEALQPCADERALQLMIAAVPDRPVVVAADMQALQQVFVNLLDNALKHSPAGSTVSIGIETGHGANPGEAPRDWARVWVADEGAGIPEIELPRIFESFYRCGARTGSSPHGVGLGLAIVRRLVEAHGGSVAVTSPPGAGCRFTVELPMWSPPPIEPSR